MPSARARVRAGAALLDAEEPGWREQISSSTLELADGSRCILGQLHGEFRRGLFRARIWDGSSAHTGKLLGSASPEDLGFFAITSEGERMADLDYAFLTRAWREELGWSPQGPTEDEHRSAPRRSSAVVDESG